MKTTLSSIFGRLFSRIQSENPVSGETSDPGLRTLDPGLRTPDSGLRTLDSGLRTSDSPRGASAFTLVELLTVVSIIAILMGMIGTASYAAKQASYRSQAQAEVREIANACRAYWIASGSTKAGARWPGSSGSIVHNGNIYQQLAGRAKDGLPGHVVLLAFDEQRFDADKANGDGGEYLDPWGNPYQVKFQEDSPPPPHQKFIATVTFPMRNRYEYYGRLFK